MGKGLEVVASVMSFFLLISLWSSSMQLNVAEARRLNGEWHIGDDHHSGRGIDELSKGVIGSTSGLKSGGVLHTYYKYSRINADHSGPTPPGEGHKNDELSQGVIGSTSGLKSDGVLHTHYKYSQITVDHSGPTPPGEGHKNNKLSQRVIGSTSGLKSGGGLHTYYKYSRATANHSGPTPPGEGHKNVPSDNP